MSGLSAPARNDVFRRRLAPAPSDTLPRAQRGHRRCAGACSRQDLSLGLIAPEARVAGHGHCAITQRNTTAGNALAGGEIGYRQCARRRRARPPATCSPAATPSMGRPLAGGAGGGRRRPHAVSLRRETACRGPRGPAQKRAMGARGWVSWGSFAVPIVTTIAGPLGVLRPLWRSVLRSVLMCWDHSCDPSCAGELHFGNPFATDFAPSPTHHPTSWESTLVFRTSCRRLPAFHRETRRWPAARRARAELRALVFGVDFELNQRSNRLAAGISSVASPAAALVAPAAPARSAVNPDDTQRRWRRADRRGGVDPSLRGRQVHRGGRRCSRSADDERWRYCSRYAAGELRWR